MTIIQKLFQNHTIRFIEQDGEMLVSANDVIRALGYPEGSLSRAWTELKQNNEKLLGTIRSIRVLAKDDKMRNAAFLDSKQLIVVLMKSNKPAAIPFQIWAIDVLHKELSKQIEQTNEQAPTYITEEAIQNQLNFLSGFFENKLVFERAELDPFAGTRKDGQSKIRRYDITEKLPKLFRIYELKKGPITESEISSTLNSKAYAEIAATHYPSRVLEIIFVGTSLDDSGRRCLERSGAQDRYQQFTVEGITYRAKVRFISVQDLAEKWLKKAYLVRPASDRWFITASVLSKLDILIDSHTKALYEGQYPTFKMLSGSNVVPLTKSIKKKAA
ncbi:hypothetical protein H6F88_31805 [Oculatella sp. FACHB-28]|uniref:BRO family protein n=1 Tax=Oculatella sp. FACHB-28 TaxID=2692845 RepID=UPI0016829352|nr:BRO family protein [Oculatella sp. FACHB-28]MBD2060529.1 hypothetical protein [Oculatella sp. FACHB-28]